MSCLLSSSFCFGLRSKNVSVSKGGCNFSLFYASARGANAAIAGGFVACISSRSSSANAHPSNAFPFMCSFLRSIVMMQSNCYEGLCGGLSRLQDDYCFSDMHALPFPVLSANNKTWAASSWSERSPGHFSRLFPGGHDQVCGLAFAGSLQYLESPIQPYVKHQTDISRVCDLVCWRLHSSGVNTPVILFYNTANSNIELRN